MSFLASGSALPAGRRGMALIMVLWITLALSIIVTGITYAVRAEVQQATAMRSGAHDRAMGQAAIVLVLQELAATGKRQLDRPQQFDVAYGGASIQVLAVPMNGLVDINRAPVPLLAALLQHAGGLPPDAAQNLAAALVEVRSTPLAQGGSRLFDAVEDLLEVPGVDYELYARLAPLITVNGGAGGHVNPYASPAPLLRALAAGSDAAVAAFLAGREAGAADTSGFDPSLITTRGSGRLRLYALTAQEPSRENATVACEASLAGSRANTVPWTLTQCGQSAQAIPVW